MGDHSRVLDVINNMHTRRYNLACDLALKGYYVFGIGYSREVVFSTKLTLRTDETGKERISEFIIHYGGRRHTYRTARGWLRTINRLTHRVDEVYRSQTDDVSTAELVEDDALVIPKGY
jgi:hypothetical protein